MNRSAVREARAEERNAVCATLAAAFEDDPISAFLFPDEATRRARLCGFYRIAIRDIGQHGRILVDEDLRAVAAWQRPSPPRPGRMRALRSLVAVTLHLRSGSLRGLRVASAMERMHIHRPHWYLGILGTHPAHQGSGLGSAVMAPMLEACEDDGLPAYLESSKESNIPFYESHGFVVTGEIEVTDGPTMWTMLREPRAATAPVASAVGREEPES